MFTASSYRPDSQPLGHFRGHPVYLATALVVAHTLMLMLCVVSPSALPQALVFDSARVSWMPQVWRWVTYPFVHSVSLWFAVEMFFLYRFGIELERVFGRKTLAVLYAGLVLLPPLLAIGIHVLFPNTRIILGGTGLVHFFLFLGICLLYPNASILSFLPQLTLKIIGSVVFAIYVLMDLSDRDWQHLTLFLANAGLTYGLLRRAGLTPRFEALSEAFAAALPKRPKFKKSMPRGPARVSSKSSSPGPSGPPGKYYEPKIRPKPDLYPEKQAVREVDELLDKIARSGLESLTPTERATLERASARLKNSD